MKYTTALVLAVALLAAPLAAEDPPDVGGVPWVRVPSPLGAAADPA